MVTTRPPSGECQPLVDSRRSCFAFRLVRHTAATGYVTGPGIYWLNGQVARRPAIELFAFATGHSVPSITLAAPYDDGSGFSVSKDGRWVVFPQRDYQGSEIMLVQGFR